MSDPSFLWGRIVPSLNRYPRSDSLVSSYWKVPPGSLEGNSYPQTGGLFFYFTLLLTASTVSVLVNNILMKEMEIHIDKVTFWTDRMTVIRYIANESKRFHTYVSNHVAFIREESSPSQWRYIDSKSNPADEASRGITADVFVRNGRWIKEPVFLTTSESEWADCAQESAELTELC